MGSSRPGRTSPTAGPWPAAAHERARKLAEQAAGHGRDGVANIMQAAVDALEVVSASLGTAADSADEAVGSLREITAQTSATEVAERLTAAGDGLDRVKTAVQGVSDGVDQAPRRVRAGRCTR